MTVCILFLLKLKWPKNKRSTPASLPCKGQVTERTTVKWCILSDTIIYTDLIFLATQAEIAYDTELFLESWNEEPFRKTLL